MMRAESTSRSTCSRSRKTAGPREVRLARVLPRIADPAHHGAQAAADVLDAVRFAFLAQLVEHGPACLVLEDPFTREDARLDVAKDLLHLGASRLTDDPRAARVIAILGRV